MCSLCWKVLAFSCRSGRWQTDDSQGDTCSSSPLHSEAHPLERFICDALERDLFQLLVGPLLVIVYEDAVEKSCQTICRCGVNYTNKGTLVRNKGGEKDIGSPLLTGSINGKHRCARQCCCAPEGSPPVPLNCGVYIPGSSRRAISAAAPFRRFCTSDSDSVPRDRSRRSSSAMVGGARNTKDAGSDAFLTASAPCTSMSRMQHFGGEPSATARTASSDVP